VSAGLNQPVRQGDQALGGAADLDADGAVTVREVHFYLQRKVHERSNGVQTPQLYNIGDMVLVRK
jgi:hypothetical protein